MSYTKFEKTNIYTYHGNCIDEQPKTYTLSDIDKLEFYTQSLISLKGLFDCSYSYPDPDQIERYIDNEECIDETDKPDFTRLIKVLFERHYDIIATIQNLQEKIAKKEVYRGLVESDRVLKAKERNDREKERLLQKEKERLLRAYEKSEKDQQKIIQKEQDRLLREQERIDKINQKEQERLLRLKEKDEKDIKKRNELEEKRIWNNELITCEDCKVSYIRFTLANHLKSAEHQSRVDAIKWILTKIQDLNTENQYDLLLSQLTKHS